MRIAKLRIENILGIDELEIEPGAVTLIEGKNGQGKTSVLEAIKAVREGGHDATLLRNGAERGEIVWVLDDGLQITKRITAKGSTVTVERDGVRERTPQSVIDSLADLTSLNPIAFIKARPAERLRILLDCLRIQPDADELAEIVGHEVHVDPSRNALDQIDAVRQSIFDDRTGTNRAIRDKTATVGQLEATLPPDGAAASDPSEVETEIGQIDEELSAELARIDTKLASLRQAHTSNIEALLAQIATAKDDMAGIERRAAAQRELVLNRYREAREPLAAELAASRRNMAQLGAATATRETIRCLLKELTSLKADSERQTAALGSLDAYKQRLLCTGIGVRGIEIREREIFRDSVPFDRLNQAQQIAIAFEIARLRAGDLKVICVDGIEAFDSEGFSAFKNLALDSAVQLFVTRVSDGDFAVRADG